MLCRRLLLVFLVLFSSPALSKELYWRSIEVDARLDGSGLLHVVETQTYVFDGDWNGGERVFDIRAGQSLHFEGVDRVEGTQIIPLTRGDVAAVDHYDVADATTLRWRSRMPDDPPFEHKELTYRIRYTLSGILRGRDNHYRLAHDFAFPDRPGAIEHFALHFTVDPLWSGIESPQTIERNNLEPGSGVIVRGELVYHGASVPDGVVVPLAAGVSYGFVLLLVAGLGALFMRFLALERKVGRFGNLTPTDEIDEAWLDKTVFSLPPEVVGAAWDGKVGASEVAAILASLAHEKKISSSIEPRFLRKPKLAMRLIADRKSITGYRASLINKLFFGSRVNTDTDAIRNHYRKSGLDLSKIIRQPIERQLEVFPKWTVKTAPVNWQFDTLVLVTAFASMVVVGVASGGNDGGLAASECFIGLGSLAMAMVAARLNSSAINNLALRFALVVAFVLPFLIGTIYSILEAPGFLFHAPVLMTAIVWNLAIFNLVLDALRIDEAPEKIAVRKKLLSARSYFIKQLRMRNPRLLDDWLPYLIAFGLGANVDSWFRSYGKAGTGGEVTADLSSSSSTPISSSKETSWTGGGGAFGGAGSSGTWAAAAAAVGAGVSSASSSSGGGSSGGGAEAAAEAGVVEDGENGMPMKS